MLLNEYTAVTKGIGNKDYCRRWVLGRFERAGLNVIDLWCHSEPNNFASCDTHKGTLILLYTAHETRIFAHRITEKRHDA